MQKRMVLEEGNELEPRLCVLDEDLEDGAESSEDEEEGVPTPTKARNVESGGRGTEAERGGRRRSPSPERHRRGMEHPTRNREPERP